MTQSRMPWDRLEGESDLWFERFDIFRQLGAVRSITQTYRIAQKERPDQITGNAPGSNWSEKVKEFRWVERARAWDDQQRQRFIEEEQEIARDRRLARLQMIQELEKQSFHALLNANIGAMNEDSARAYLPQLRMLIISLLGVERVELGGATDGGDEPSSDLSDDIKQSLSAVFAGKKVVVADGDAINA